MRDAAGRALAGPGQGVAQAGEGGLAVETFGTGRPDRVAAALGVLGVVLSEFYSALPITRAIGEVSWSTSTQFILMAVPLYIFMGEILMRTGIAERMYNAMIQWVGAVLGSYAGLRAPSGRGQQ